jgi:hypothetical protein
MGSFTKDVDMNSPIPALSSAQLKSTLWADNLVHVYALVVGRLVGELPERLAAADSAAELGSYDCLWPGALSPLHRQQAPYLVRLKQESPFTDWLLLEAAAGFGEWGVVMRSKLSFLALRSHCRECSKARLADGLEIALDWMDPAVLRALLPLAPNDQVEELLGVLETAVVTGPRAWTFVSQQFGRLAMRDQPLMVA